MPEKSNKHIFFLWDVKMDGGLQIHAEEAKLKKKNPAKSLLINIMRDG